MSSGEIAASRADLTRSLCINAYLFRAGDEAARAAFLANADARFTTSALETLTRTAAERIGARILSLASERFEPEGASATLLIAQERSTLGHLDKSHISVHTFSTQIVDTPAVDESPQGHPGDTTVDPTACFRVECEISTCGEDSPIAGIAVILKQLQPDIVTLDGRVRGVAQRQARMLAPTPPAGYEAVALQNAEPAGWYVVWAREDAVSVRDRVRYFVP